MSMIASVLHLNRKAVRALRVNDTYSLHRVVYSLYEDVRSADHKAASAASGILYADQGGDHTGRSILMLADRAPAASVDGQHGHVQSKVVPDHFLQHPQYRFKVIVNPTKRDSASRKLLPVRGRESVAEWFTDRAGSSWGFTVSAAHLQVERIDVQQFKHKQRRQVTIAQAHIQGLLRLRPAPNYSNCR